MDNRFYDNEFEKYLKEEADDYRMYPSDHVWRNIQQEIHGYRKWPALTAISIFVISALVVGTVLVKPHTEIASVQPILSKTNSVSESATTVSVKPKQQIVYPSAKETYHQNTAITNSSSVIYALQGNITQIQQPLVEDIFAIATAVPENEINSSNSNANTTTTNLNIKASDLQIQKASLEITAPVLIAETRVSKTASAIKQAHTPEMDLKPYSSLERSIPEKTEYNNKYLFANLEEFQNGYNTNKQLSFIFNDSKKSNAENSPLSKLSGKSSKFDFQFFVTPSISYRRLVDNVNGELSKSYITALPFAANYVVDVNHVIQHTPARGYEVGFALGYNLNKNFAIRSGFQFNVRQYDINAYVHPFEAATIALLTGNSNSFVNTVSGFRNIPGSTPIILRNRYYEISMPVGVDWKPISGKISWGIAASVQPTYTFDKEPFIITSNYKNYADGSQLLRNWNINANLETYIGYSAGKYRWQIGPQIRYQVMPTMSTAYPIKEYLIDYGIKLSLTRILK